MPGLTCVCAVQWQRRKPKTCGSCEGSGTCSCPFCNGTGGHKVGCTCCIWQLSPAQHARGCLVPSSHKAAWLSQLPAAQRVLGSQPLAAASPFCQIMDCCRCNESGRAAVLLLSRRLQSVPSVQVQGRCPALRSQKGTRAADSCHLAQMLTKAKCAGCHKVQTLQRDRLSSRLDAIAIVFCTMYACIIIAAMMEGCPSAYPAYGKRSWAVGPGRVYSERLVSAKILCPT